MEKPTLVLSNEHKNIIKVVNALNNECSAIEDGKAVDKAFFEKAIDFIRNYADKFHHAKEEDILFKELCKGLEEGLQKSDKEKILENARGYAQLLQDHIYKEDNILYPMADQALNGKVQKEMLERFKQAEKKRFGKGIKEKYLAIAKELEKLSRGS